MRAFALPLTEDFTNNVHSTYSGRFAPSPTGPLHFGSLFTALASYLQAKHNNGQWFVRIEDIDTYRVQSGSSEDILHTLTEFGLNWDMDPQVKKQPVLGIDGCLMQSKNLTRYQQVMASLIDNKQCYNCACTRREITQMGGLYTGLCRDKNVPEAGNVIRLKQTQAIEQFTDVLFGCQQIPNKISHEDFILKRRDGLFAYQFVVVVDDIDQQITEVVRGGDIMEITGRQISLFKTLQALGLCQQTPDYFHLPMIASKPNYKLSKHNHAPAVNTNQPKPELIHAMKLLGLPIQLQPDLQSGSVKQIIDWGIEHWSIQPIPKIKEIII